MKKIIGFLLSSLFTIGVLSAQGLDKGNFVIGSTMGFSTSNSKVKLSSTDANEEGDGPSATQVNFAPNVGYFLANNFTLGIGLDYTFNSVKEPNEDEVNDSDLLFGPFFRYYIRMNSGVALFVQTNFGFGSSSDQQYIGTETRTIKSNIFAVGAGPGFTIFSNNLVGIEALAKYNFARSNFNTKEGGTTVTTETNTHQIDLSIGIQFYL